MAKTYEQAGVNIAASDEFVRRIKDDKIRSTSSKAVLADSCAFVAVFGWKFKSNKEPVLVSSVDGVGRKLKVAFLMKNMMPSGKI